MTAKSDFSYRHPSSNSVICFSHLSDQGPMAGTVSDPTEASARTVRGGCNPEGQLSRQSCRSRDTENLADAGLLLGTYGQNQSFPGFR